MLNVGFERRATVSDKDHPKLEGQVQRLSVGQHDITYDTIEIRVNGADEGEFMLAYVKPELDDEGKIQYWKSEKMQANSDAEHIEAGIKGFYHKFRVTPLVTRTLFDSEGSSVDAIEDAHSIIYKVEVPRPLDEPSVETIMVVPISTMAQITVAYPTEVQESSPPMDGSFFISCHTPEGDIFRTHDLNIKHVNSHHIKTALERDCGFLKDKVRVEQPRDNFQWNSMGVDFNIYFSGVGQNLNQFEFHSSIDDPLSGENIEFKAREAREGGQGLVWDVIPAEHFFTYETEPQVIVQVDDMPALCTGLNCNFSYFVGNSIIDDFSLSGNRLSISGSNFDDILKVEMGHIACNNVASSSTSITCDLEGKLPAGSWWPSVIEDKGKVQVESSVSPEVVNMIISNVDPKIDLNPAGGNIMTITGDNFPPTLDSRYQFAITLDGKTRCVPFETSYTEVKCETEPFTSSRRRNLAASDFDMSMSLIGDGGPVEETDGGFGLTDTPVTASSLNPSRLAPIAFTTFDVQLNADYPTDGMTKEDF